MTAKLPAWRASAAAREWMADLERRMARADSPIPCTDEEATDVREALILSCMAKLPAGHPLKITRADVDLLRSARHDPLAGERLAERLEEFLSPGE